MGQRLPRCRRPAAISGRLRGEPLPAPRLPGGAQGVPGSSGRARGRCWPAPRPPGRSTRRGAAGGPQQAPARVCRESRGRGERERGQPRSAGRGRRGPGGVGRRRLRSAGPAAGGRRPRPSLLPPARAAALRGAAPWSGLGGARPSPASRVGSALRVAAVAAAPRRRSAPGPSGVFSLH